MAQGATSSKPFEPGTTGWTAGDLDDPRIEEKWVEGSYEIVEGVLTTMPPAYFVGGKALFNLMYAVRSFQERAGIPGDFSIEVDLVIDDERVAKADAVWMTPEEQARQADVARRAGRAEPDRARILVPPTLVIESVSPGHERHDRHVKRKWYAEWGVANYWLLDAFDRSLECLVLEGGSYRADQHGRGDAEVRPAVFQGLVVSLSRLWAGPTAGPGDGQ
jgi:Uma2 family endonuclease